MKASILCILALAAATLATPRTASAAMYLVNRAWTDGPNTASLIGTVTVPEGNYTITNQGPAPFTNVDLTLTVNGNAAPLNSAKTNLIYDSGAFLITATPTTLTFNTTKTLIGAADLLFQLGTDSTNRYAIGSDGSPHFQVGFVGAAQAVDEVMTFPTVFGVVVPEPSSVALGAVTAALALRRRRVC